MVTFALWWTKVPTLPCGHPLVPLVCKGLVLRWVDLGWLGAVQMRTSGPAPEHETVLSQDCH